MDELKKAENILKGSTKDQKNQVSEFSSILKSGSKETEKDKEIKAKVDELLSGFDPKVEDHLKENHNTDSEGLKKMLFETIKKANELGIQVDIVKLIESAKNALG